ncbi:hypothetical protein BDZ89DRAFT_1158670 [Hymenopellis radicata]|nr:hypothetical protein BDZ89DRAFT_1158670 [Hymenopellis radicata]
MPQTRTEGQMLTREDYIRRKFQTGELLNGFPLTYATTERPPPADTFVNGRRTPTYMLCWKLIIDADEIEDRYDCDASEIRSLFALPRWKERKYADQFGVEMLPRLQIVGPFLLILFGVNLSEEKILVLATYNPSNPMPYKRSSVVKGDSDARRKAQRVNEENDIVHLGR